MGIERETIVIPLTGGGLDFHGTPANAAGSKDGAEIPGTDGEAMAGVSGGDGARQPDLLLLARAALARVAAAQWPGHRYGQPGGLRGLRRRVRSNPAGVELVTEDHPNPLVATVVQFWNFDWVCAFAGVAGLRVLFT